MRHNRIPAVRIRIVFYSLFFVLTAAVDVSATHIRAGEIIAERVSESTLTYRVTLVGYRNRGSDIVFGEAGTIEFGDGTTLIAKENALVYDIEIISNNTEKVTIVMPLHTYQSPGRYNIRFLEPNRNAGILNMSNSVGTLFYIETQILIDPFIGQNSSPVLLIPPIDEAAVGAAYFHNPGATEPDGDSLSYRIIACKQNIGKEVGDYRFPNDSKFGGTQESGSGDPIFKLDPATGDLVWDAPGMMGEYNIAIIVEEWRLINERWIKVGYVTRDMQIFVNESNNNRPEIKFPDDTCLEAGELLQGTIEAKDPDNHSLTIDLYGDPFEVIGVNAPLASPDIINGNNTLPSPAKISLSWQTECNLVRERPYVFFGKVIDNPPTNTVPPIKPPLAAFDQWKVTIVAPAPETLTAILADDEKSISLNWDDYTKTCFNANEMQIWRRVGSYPLSIAKCLVGMPPDAGYELINEISSQNTAYVDTSQLASGGIYCYRLVATFPSPGNGESYVSEESCDTLKFLNPIITNVSIEETSELNGEIRIGWRAPKDNSNPNTPFKYKLYRGEGYSGKTNALEVLLANPEDTFGIDAGLNTETNVYHYWIELYENDMETKLGESVTASSVRADIKATADKIGISWQAQVPWSIKGAIQPKQYIFRDQVLVNFPDSLVAYDTIYVNTSDLNYSDRNVIKGESYCYRITTIGTYGYPPLDSLVNKSQVVCAKANDIVPPCKVANLEVNNPTLEECISFMRDKPCDFNTFSNTLSWWPEIGEDCENDISQYYIYFSRTGKEGSYQLIDSTRFRFYEHINLESFAGCYQISALDAAGNESPISNIICKDNCPNYALPNFISPNGDTKNDIFTPFNSREQGCVRFIKDAEITIVSRWGNMVYTNQGETNRSKRILIEWDGTSLYGVKVKPSYYFYHLKYIEDVLSNNGFKSIRGDILVNY